MIHFFLVLQYPVQYIGFDVMTLLIYFHVLHQIIDVEMIQFVAEDNHQNHF